MMKVGGTSKVKAVTPEVQKICDQVRTAVEEKIGKPLEEFIAKTYTSQVVAGTNFFVKVSIGAGSFVHVRVYRDLQGTVSLHGLQQQRSEVDELEYF